MAETSRPDRGGRGRGRRRRRGGARRSTPGCSSPSASWTMSRPSYIAPDGALHLVPFHRLRLPDGRFWTDRRESARRADRPRPAAPGARPPGQGPARARRHRLRRRADAGGRPRSLRPARRRPAAISRSQADACAAGPQEPSAHGFAPLPGSGEEVEGIARCTAPRARTSRSRL